jgi:hypothetical protein
VDKGDLIEDGRLIEVDLTTSGADDETMELAYKEGLRTGDFKEYGLGRHSL